MPFTNDSFLQKKKTKKILFLSFDSDISGQTIDYAQHLKKTNEEKVLWIDGNLGASETEKIYDPLEKVLNDKAALSKAIRHIKEIFILSGKTSIPLSNKSQNFQGQFLYDLDTLSENFDRIVVSFNLQDKDLLPLWFHWAEKKYLFFQNKNITLEKVFSFLKENEVDGLIPLEENTHQSELIWLRLKKELPNTPQLILDIKKTAQ